MTPRSRREVSDATPSATSPSPAWYTDDVTLYSAAHIWRVTCRVGLAGPLIALFFLLRKAIGWRFRATYGTARPDRLPLVPAAEVPPEVRDALAPALSACKDAAMSVCFAVRPASIGGRTTYSVVMLDSDGRTCATAMWLQSRIGRSTVERAMLSCHSRTADGADLDTGVLDPASDRRLILSGHDLLGLPLGTSPEDVIRVHRERIASRADLVRLDCDSIAAHMLEESRRFFDWRVEHGFLVALTPREVRRLSGG